MKLLSPLASSLVVTILAFPSLAAPISFTTGPPNGLMATASRPSSPGKIEIETADDFILTTAGSITTATFTGLLTGAAPSIDQVRVEIYRVFPKDSTTPPSGAVPTRTNSPSDVAFEERDTAGSSLTYTTTILSPTFVAANSVLNGINPLPGVTTGGEGAVTGQEVLFSISFVTPLNLPADHYFFIPQVAVTGGEFYWLSAARPAPFAPDLQSWIRNETLAPDWLRIGTDIVGPSAAGAPAPTFNASFSITGEELVPEPSTFALAGLGLLFAGLLRAGSFRARR